MSILECGGSIMAEIFDNKSLEKLKEGANNKLFFIHTFG